MFLHYLFLQHLCCPAWRRRHRPNPKVIAALRPIPFDPARSLSPRSHTEPYTLNDTWLGVRRSAWAERSLTIFGGVGFSLRPSMAAEALVVHLNPLIEDSALKVQALHPELPNLCMRRRSFRYSSQTQKPSVDSICKNS